MNPTDNINDYNVTSSFCPPITFNQPCDWQNNPAVLGKTVYVLPLGSHDQDYPFACGVGLLGGSLASQQTSATCAGFCPAGFTCGAEATVAPAACPKGHYCPKGTSVALPCLPGSYSDATSLTSASECTETDAGHFAPTGSIQQIKCSPGTVAPNSNMGACLKCEAGTFQATLGQLMCGSCTPGSYCAEGAAAALPCSKGSYSGATDLSSAGQCTTTNAGYYASTGSTQQTPCNPGTMAPAVGMGACELCEPGKFQPESSSTACLPCAVASYCPNRGTTSPTPCPGGTYSNKNGHAHEWQCTSVEPTFYAPTGSRFPEECPASGFVCPGRAADNTNEVPGSKPIPVVSISSPPTPSPPSSVGTVVLTLTASGSVSDFSENDKSSLQQKVADAAGVDKSLVTIRVVAASVSITATIAVPASTTADAVQTSLSSTLGTAAAASAALGVTVEEVPTVALADGGSESEDPLTPPGSDDSQSSCGGGCIAGIVVGCSVPLL
eukprot:scaffold41164_cov69-Phaeocystis_antarctica.AAC.1